MLLDARSAGRPALTVAASPAAGAAAVGSHRARRRQSIRRRTLAVADVTGFVLASLALSSLRDHQLEPATLRSLLVGGLVLVLVAKVVRLYDVEVQQLLPSALDEIPRLMVAVSVTLVIVVFLVVPLGQAGDLTRWDLFALWWLMLLLLPATRTVARALSRRLASPERIAVVGDDPLTAVLITSFRQRRLEVEVVELAGDGPSRSASDIADRCHAAAVDRVVLVSDAFETDVAVELVRQLRQTSVGVSIVPRVAEETGPRVLVEHVDGVGLMGVPPIGRTRSTMVLKRGFDLLLTVPIAVLALPPMALIALVVRATSAGPALYRQQRIGRDGAPFTMLKFRTMVDGAHEGRIDLSHLNVHADGRLFKVVDDPRVTRVGAWLRRTALDELPQLFNILRGDMSIVGPRPLLPEEDGHVVGWHRRRLDLTPGLTGPWQILQGHRVPFDAMVKIDYLYVLEWSPWTDLKIILRTLPVVVGFRSL